MVNALRTLKVVLLWDLFLPDAGVLDDVGPALKLGRDHLPELLGVLGAGSRAPEPSRSRMSGVAIARKSSSCSRLITASACRRPTQRCTSW